MKLQENQNLGIIRNTKTVLQRCLGALYTSIVTFSISNRRDFSLCTCQRGTLLSTANNIAVQLISEQHLLGIAP